MIYIKVNEDNETLNAFETIGMAIADIEMEKKRTREDLIKIDRLTELVWEGDDHRKYVRRILEVEPCNNPSLDFMMRPRPVRAEL